MSRRRKRGKRRIDPRRKSANGHLGPKRPTKPFPKDPDATFRLSKGFDSDVLGEEIKILTRLSDALTERLGPDASPQERHEAVDRLCEEDPELAALNERLKELIRTNPKSVARHLSDLGRKEAEEEGWA